MDSGIVVLSAIILIDLIAVVGVLYLGSQHDHHHSIHDVESSQSVNLLTQRAQARASKLQALEKAFEQGQVTEEQNSSTE